MPLCPPSRRPRTVRLIRYQHRRLRARCLDLFLRAAVRLDAWIYLAAGALIGFEGLEVLFGAMLVAPEFVPIVLLVLALIWTVRNHGDRLRRRLVLFRLRRRVRRVRRPPDGRSHARRATDPANLER